MKMFIFLIVSAFLAAGCRPAGQTDQDFILKISAAEYRLAGRYFTPDINQAESSLRSYLAETEGIVPADEASEVRHMLYSGRALALARLEFLLASKGQHIADLRNAVLVFRKATPSNAKLTDQRLAIALTGIVEGDIGQVGWLGNFEKLAADALKFIEPTRQP